MKKPETDLSRLRDQIAMHAASAFPHLMIANEPELVAYAAYKLADKMLVEREKSKPIT